MAREIKVTITGDASSLNKAFGQAAGDTDGFGAKMSKLGDGMANVGKKMSIGITAPILLAGKQALDAAAEAEVIAAQTEAALKSTGGVAGVTAEHIGKLAESIDRKSMADDEAIQSGANLLLTFTNIRNEGGKAGGMFDQATQAAVDLSQAMGMDMSSAAMLVGKALNDPVKGVTALSRAGVQFTQVQKDQIKAMVDSGNAAGAQALILKEFNTQFGGSAAAAANTEAGKRQQAMEDMGNALEKLGAIISPVITKIANVVTDLTAKFQKLTPAQQEMIVKVAAIAAALGPALIVLGKITSAVGALTPVFAKIGGAGAKMGGLLVKSFLLIGKGFMSLTTMLMANPIILIIAGITAVIVGLTILIVKNWDTIVAALKAAWEWIQNTASTVWNAIKTAASAAWNAIVETVMTPIRLLIAWYQLQWNLLKAATEAVWNAIKWTAASVWNGIKAVIVNPILHAKDLVIAGLMVLKNVATAIWDGLRNSVAGTVDSVVSKFQWLADRIRAIWNGIKATAEKLIFWRNSPSEMEINAQQTVDKLAGIFAPLRDVVPDVTGNVDVQGQARSAAAAASGVTIHVHVGNLLSGRRELIEAVHEGLLRKQSVNATLGIA